MYRIIVLIGLVFTYLGSILSGFFGAAKPAEVKTVPVNGSLAAVDALGRETVSAGASDKKVGVFYFLWNGEHNLDGPYDVTKIIANDPNAFQSDASWTAAGGGPMGYFHHWSEPLFGYYFQADKWVVRKHCQMLTDAGVDFIVFDATNANPYIARTLDLIDVWYEYYQQGWNVPKIAFYTASYSGTVMNRIYDELYNNPEVRAKYPEIDNLWFKMNGKPMIVGIKDDEALRDDVKDYFRIKAKQWPDDKVRDGFPWMEFSRLGKLTSYYKNSPWDESIMNVSVAQHCDTCCFSSSAWYGSNDHGRSWHNGAKDASENAVLYGYNFDEQWDFAQKLDPDIVFVTGFNEWVAQRLTFRENEPFGFCDNCDEEYSRDFEPSAGVLGDNYYMQFVDRVAGFKGSTAALPAAEEVTIDIGGGFDQWDDETITGVYRDYTNDTVDRDCRGYGDTYYKDTSGRNDIADAKVAHDGEKLYFYVDTAADLTPCTDDNWMQLFVNVSGERAGYEYIVNRTSPENGKATVERITDHGYEIVGQAEIRFEGDRLMLSVERSLLGIEAEGSFCFKWADNCDPADIYSFYTKGDSAPYGRLNWVYSTAAPQPDDRSSKGC